MNRNESRRGLPWSSPGTKPVFNWSKWENPWTKKVLHIAGFHAENRNKRHWHDINTLRLLLVVRRLFEWPRAVAADRLLVMWVRFPREAWMFVACEFVCCHVEASATDWSFPRRSPTDCGVAECDRKVPIRAGHVPESNRRATWKKKSLRAEIILRTIALLEFSNFVIFWFVALPRLVSEQQLYGVARCLHLTLTLTKEEARHPETE